ncbi:nardilysin isoformx2 [Lasius niger]|uniref:Nardilysin isoformx2 n=1 Tax=Lasius niger TaxID=67767 RepID=A0A0J7KE90_LASNI|nr:nardilysin isoformx2 [Lasius niger]
MVDYPTLVTKMLFELMRERELEILYNSFIPPGDLMSDVKLYILKHIHYTDVDKYTALCDVNFETFQNFIKSFNNRLYIQCLVQGNMTQDAVLENSSSKNSKRNRTEESYNCETCGYSTNDKSNIINRHNSSPKHKNNVLGEGQSNEGQSSLQIPTETPDIIEKCRTKEYNCKTCDYRTNDKSNMNKHNNSKKHQNSPKNERKLEEKQSNNLEIPTEETLKKRSPKQNKNLEDRVKIEELCTSMTSLNEKYKTQERLISEQATEIITLKNDLENEIIERKKINENLSSLKEQLKTLSYDLELEKKKNENLSAIEEQLKTITHNINDWELGKEKINEQLQTLTSYNVNAENRVAQNIQKLKTNIKVFCRVRPTTPKEMEQKKT